MRKIETSYQQFQFGFTFVLYKTKFEACRSNINENLVQNGAYP